MNEIVAKRYAQALLKVSGVDMGKVSGLTKSFAPLLELFALPQARKVLLSPTMPNGLKKALLDYSFDEGNVEPLVRNFFYVVLEAGRVDLIPLIVSWHKRLVDEANNIVRVNVEAATELSAEDLDAIRKALSNLKGTLEITTRVNPDLLGGFVVQFSDSRIDMSVRANLKAMMAAAAL